MQKTFDILCQGSMCTELLAWVDRYPDAGDAIHADPIVWTGGGMAANAAEAIAKLGGRVALISATGDDSFGKKSLVDLERMGVNVDHVAQRKGQASPIVILMVDPLLRRAGLVLGMNKKAELKPDEVPDELMVSSKIYFTDTSSNENSLILAQRAKTFGCIVAFDMQMTEAHTNRKGLDNIINNLVEFTDYYFADRENFLTWTSTKTVRDGCIKVLSQHPQMTIAITKGKDGSIIANSKEFIEVPAFEVSVIDTIGAGDAYHGAFLLTHSILGWDLKTAGIFSSAVAALSCTKPGAREGLPNMDQVLSFLDAKNVSLMI